MQNLWRNTTLTHTLCDFTLKPLKFYSFRYILNKKLLILMHLHCYVILWVKIAVANYAHLVCNFFGLKIQSCKFFDKSYVCKKQDKITLLLKVNHQLLVNFNFNGSTKLQRQRNGCSEDPKQCLSQSINESMTFASLVLISTTRETILAWHVKDTFYG